MSQFWGSISEYPMEKGLNCENHQCLFCGNIFLGFWKHDYEKKTHVECSRCGASYDVRLDRTSPSVNTIIR